MANSKILRNYKIILFEFEYIIRNRFSTSFITIMPKLISYVDVKLLLLSQYILCEVSLFKQYLYLQFVPKKGILVINF